jgi:hypothetical protein
LACSGLSRDLRSLLRPRRDRPRRHASDNDPEAKLWIARFMQGLRGVMRDPVVEIKLAEPSVGKVQLDLLAQTAFVSDAVAVSNNGQEIFPRDQQTPEALRALQKAEITWWTVRPEDRQAWRL